MPVPPSATKLNVIGTPGINAATSPPTGAGH